MVNPKAESQQGTTELMQLPFICPHWKQDQEVKDSVFSDRLWILSYKKTLFYFVKLINFWPKSFFQGFQEIQKTVPNVKYIIYLNHFNSKNYEKIWLLTYS